MTDRSMPVPEGLAGMRVDAGVARLLGVSRTAAAALAEDGGVELRSEEHTSELQSRP